MSARRPLLTALGATTLLGALWFVPSAGATSVSPADATPGAPANANTQVTGVRGDQVQDQTQDQDQAQEQDPGLLLADTGSTDTSPYLLGGTLCLGVGAGFVAFSARRARA
ncbi:LPXTG cell wall anchor domain-containing protein [Streptomyces sp. NBC_00536]|uniref:LPXTG cell wall anchor domain-containing protein n=1 Tax=Streptomyces sp. NBC_00536 TaxID=2975769 RepID=UPI002E80DB65|nr:LPXTG cell wall anchor domain-containing protein [Streptomyces sp. NBC_00536]WUC80936.1 LPXTG cell wall anchor domain-containing protein [Streptomyces sp. NBC_00536]